MKKIITLLVSSIIILIILFFACEKRKDPFSLKNEAPQIGEFSFVAGPFAKDSLKFTTKEPFKIKLIYEDDEDQKLTATFRFLAGHGDIFHSDFDKISETTNSITFDALSKFNSETDGRLNFIPDAIGKVEIELELSDQVKTSTKTAQTFFFDNLIPVAVFEYKLLTTVSPYELEVDASKSYDPDDLDRKIKLYSWWFDDDTPIEKTPDPKLQHIYKKAGRYKVRLKVEDKEGAVDSTEQIVSTNNQKPIANLQVNPKTGKAPLTIEYTAGNSIDRDGEIVSYRIDFDDGTSSLDSFGTHTYTTDDNYRVKLTVQDNLGQIDTTSILVKVETPPVAVLKVTPNSGPFPLDCVIDGTDSYDPQGGKLEHDIFIDGQLRYDNIDSVLHTFNTPKTYLVRLTVTSQRNNTSDSNQKVVIANNLNPKADFNWQPPSPQHQTPVTYTSTSTDPNPTDEITNYKWIFPLGITVEGKDKSIVIQTFDAGVDTYRVELRVWDKYQGYDAITKIIKINK